MKICSEKHDEIVYDGRACPACALVEDLDRAERDVDRLEKEIKELEGRVQA